MLRRAGSRVDCRPVTMASTWTRISFAIALCLAGRQAAAQSGQKAIIGIDIVGNAPEIVFDHRRDQQQQYNIADAPVAAWKDADGMVSLVLPGFENYRMRGQNLHSVTIDPREIFSSQKQAERTAEFAYDYDSWLVAPYTLDGKTVYALAHMEWYACLIAGQCTGPGGIDYTAPSWVTTVTSFVSRDGGASWAPNGANGRHVVANPGYTWFDTPAMRHRLYLDAIAHGLYDQTGLMAQTRLVREGGYIYAIGQMLVRDFPHADWANGVAPVIATGFVVMRTADVTRPAGWEIWAQGSTFIPIAAARASATYGSDPHVPLTTHTNYGLFNPTPGPSLGQLVFDAVSNNYVLVSGDFSANELYFSTTPSLADPHWSTARPIGRSSSAGSDAFVYDPRANQQAPHANPACSTYARGFVPANYASLLDANAPGLNFEATVGSPELYYVVNPALYPGPCQGDNLARDVYRVALRFTYGVAGSGR